MSAIITGPVLIGSTPYGSIGTNFNAKVEGYASGTVYSLTGADAAIVFGTTQAQITLTLAGTYLLIGRAYLRYNGATYAGTQTATVHLQRTNNTPTAVINATTTATLRVITTITDTVGIMSLPIISYVATAGDIITIYGALSATPAAGSVDVAEASILALKLF